MPGKWSIEMLRLVVGVAPHCDIAHGHCRNYGEQTLGVPVGNNERFAACLGESGELAAASCLTGGDTEGGESVAEIDRCAFGASEVVYVRTEDVYVLIAGIALKILLRTVAAVGTQPGYAPGAPTVVRESAFKPGIRQS